MFAALSIALVLTAAPSRFDELMQKARVAYTEASLDVALSELLAADAIATTDAQRATVALAQGVVLASVPNLEAANSAWERGLSIDPSARLPLPAPPKVRAEFEKLQGIVLRMRPKVAPPPPVAVAPPPSAVEVRHVTVPAVLTLGVAVASAALGVGLSIAFVNLDADLATRSRPSAEVTAALSQRDGLRAGLFAAYGVAAALAVISVVLLVRGVEVQPGLSLLPGSGGLTVLARLRF